VQGVYIPIKGKGAIHVGLAMDQMRVNAKVDAITNRRSDTLPSPAYFVHLIKRYQRKVEKRVARMLT